MQDLRSGCALACGSNNPANQYFFPSNQQVKEREANLFAAQLFRVELLFKQESRRSTRRSNHSNKIICYRSRVILLFDIRPVLASPPYFPSSSLSSINEESKAETDLRR